MILISQRRHPPTCTALLWICSCSGTGMTHRAQISMGLGYVGSGTLGAIITRCTWSSWEWVIIPSTVVTRSAVKAVTYRPCTSAVAECAWGACSRGFGALEAIVASRTWTISGILWYWRGCWSASFPFTEPSWCTWAFRNSLCVVLWLKDS